MKAKTGFIITALLFALFIVFTAIVMNVDVQPAGPLNSDIGLATINTKAYDALGENSICYTISEAGGVLSLFSVLCFALYGLYQLIKKKGIKLVDKNLYIYAAFVVLVLIAYIFFEFFIVNYRPILVDNELEASYPSSHTMLVICAMSAAGITLWKLTKKKVIRIVSTLIPAFIIVITVVGRLFSGVHWLTDIIGGVLLGSTLVMLYYSVSKSVE